MRYIVTLFWSFVLGQVVGYIGGALTKGAYDFTLTTIIFFDCRRYCHFTWCSCCP